MLTKLRTIWHAAGWVRSLICLPLCLALWNAPLPWVHRHEMTETAADRDLAWHLEHFHPAMKPHLAASEWHLHFALLWQMGGCDQRTPEDPDQSPLPVLMMGDHNPGLMDSTISASVDIHRLLAWGDTFFACPLEDELLMPAATVSPPPVRQFLQTFSARMPLRDILSVARC